MIAVKKVIIKSTIEIEHHGVTIKVWKTETELRKEYFNENNNIKMQMYSIIQQGRYDFKHMIEAISNISDKITKIEVKDEHGIGIGYEVQTEDH
jgi:hypothetical protein